MRMFFYAIGKLWGQSKFRDQSGKRGSRNSVGIGIQLSDSEEEKLGQSENPVVFLLPFPILRAQF